MKDTKKILCCIFSTLAVLFFRFLPAPSGMTPSGMQVLGVFLGTVILWLSESISWPSLLCLAGLSLVPEMKMTAILTSSFGSTIFAFLLFTFLCTYALGQTSFIKRCAVRLITNKLASKGAWWLITCYCLSVLLIGMIMSPSVLFVIFMPIYETICQELKLEKSDKLANSLALGTLYCCAISCGMTPISHAFPVMAMDFCQQMAGRTISYGSYMAAAIPVGLICFAAMLLMFRFILRPDTTRLKNLDLSKLKAEISPLQVREIWIIGIFAAVVAAWLIPELMKGILPGIYSFFKDRGTAFPPMIGALMLFMLSVDGKPLLDFRDAMAHGVQWGSLIMAAAALAIGSALTHPDIALTNWLSGAIKPLLSGMAPLMIVLLFMVWTFLMTNACSNMVTTTVVCALAIPVALASSGQIHPAAVAAMIGMGASYAFILPPAHPNVALAAGSGWTNTSQLLCCGLVLMAVAIAATMGVGYPLASTIMQ